MKKRLLMFMLSFGLFFSMSGCQKTYLPDKEATDSTRDDNDINTDAGNDTNDKTDMDKSDSDREMAVVPSDVLADGGNVYLVYSDKSIKKMLSGKENKYTYAKLVDDLIYVETRDEETGEAVLTAMDADGNTVDTILDGYSSFDLSVGKYKGKIYVTYSTYDVEKKVKRYLAFEYAPEDKSLKKDSAISNAMRYISNNSYSYIGGFRSLIATLDKCGEALLSSDGKIFALNIEDYSISSEYTYLDGYDFGYVDAVFGDYALYHSMDDYSSPSNYFVLDLKTGKKDHIMEFNSDESAEILDAADDCIYYSLCDDKDESTAYVYSYNVKEMTNNRLYTAVTPPGTGEFSLRCGISNAKYIGGRLYVWDIADAKAVWAYFDTDTEKYEQTDMVIHEYSYGKYGTVSVAQGNQFYDGTDEISYRYMIEDFTLNDSVPNYEAINECLKKDNDGYFESAMNGMDNMKDEIYDEEGWNYYMSLDRTLENVQMIGSHYMQITFYLYYYSGGAHGEGWSDYLMFDLDSGKPITLSMLTDIDEASYKKLVAEKSMMVWKTNKYGFYREYEDSTQEERDKMYQDFYDGADINNDNIGFYEDGVILYYPPYQYGPYASGFMEVPISYEELGIDINN